MDRKSFLCFHRELLEIVENAASADKYLAEPKIDAKIKKLLGTIHEFNRKYPSLKLEYRHTAMKGSLRIFFADLHDLKSAFEHASKIPGLQSIGATSYDEALISQEGECENIITNAKGMLYLSYAGGAFILALDKKSKFVGVIYNPLDAGNKSSAFVQLLASIALPDSNKDIDIFQKHGHIGFTDLLNEEERKRMLARFNPTWRE